MRPNPGLIACCLLGPLCLSGGSGPRPAAVRFPALASDDCKPLAPLALELGAVRARLDGAVELDYTVRALVACELLEPRVALGAGWTLVEHASGVAGPAASGEARAGRLVLRGGANAAALELTARLALPEPEAPGGVIVHERVFAFGAPRPAVLEGVRTVRTAAQLSRDVPALVR
ncbi:MAG: hypothetical protein EPO68_08360 [Planctomycetota bacterium]|nr:MAG: hypothetical protein EPO68_08360 [Planctomycetota bacterium]